MERMREAPLKLAVQKGRKSRGQMSKMYHEGKACDAVLCYIEARDSTRCDRDKICLPDHVGYKAPIDLACRIDGRLFAFEHTSIQYFKNEFKLAKDAANFFKPIEKNLSSILPRSEQYVLYVPVTATQELKGFRPRKIEQTQNAIIDWVRELAPILPVSSWYGKLTWQCVAGVPFHMSLCKCGQVIDPDDEQLWVVRVVESGLSATRQNRIMRAYNEKVEQLAPWKRDSNARTVLILETIHGPVQWKVADAILDIVKVAENRPDEIYLVMTHHDRQWWVSPLLVDCRSIYELNEPNQWAWKIDAKSLNSLTGR
jgi:hypothetical protein